MTEIQISEKIAIRFEDFYALYPRHDARRDAQKAWMQIGAENQIKAMSALPNHVRAWKAMETDRRYIPLPASWLRGWRWEDEIVIEVPKPKQNLALVAWWTSEVGVLAEGKRRGLEPRPGESMATFKARVGSTQTKCEGQNE